MQTWSKFEPSILVPLCYLHIQNEVQIIILIIFLCSQVYQNFALALMTCQRSLFLTLKDDWMEHTQIYLERFRISVGDPMKHLTQFMET